MLSKHCLAADIYSWLSVLLVPPLFHDDPSALWGGMWYRCPIGSWAFHSLFLFYVLTVVSLCVNGRLLQKLFGWVLGDVLIYGSNGKNLGARSSPCQPFLGPMTYLISHRIWPTKSQAWTPSCGVAWNPPRKWLVTPIDFVLLLPLCCALLMLRVLFLFLLFVF